MDKAEYKKGWFYIPVTCSASSENTKGKRWAWGLLWVPRAKPGVRMADVLAVFQTSHWQFWVCSIDTQLPAD